MNLQTKSNSFFFFPLLTINLKIIPFFRSFHIDFISQQAKLFLLFNIFFVQTLKQFLKN